VSSAVGGNLSRMHKTEKRAKESRMNLMYSYLCNRTLDLSRLWLWVNFYEDEVELLKEGERLTVVFPALANRSFEGKISVINPTIDPVKRTTLVRIDIPNPDGQLRPGMSANVTADIDDSIRVGSPHRVADGGFCRPRIWQNGAPRGSRWTAGC
jgi:Cu(I)/Ag(I) efflux system membrane fusion protein